MKVLLSWSSGKDSAWALHVLRTRLHADVAGLLTTFNASANRVAMHAVRRELVEAQAAAAGLPLWDIPLPSPCSDAEYSELMRGAMQRARAEGFTHVAFGDLFLEDVRRYREERLAGSGMTPLFPLWGQPTRALAQEMFDAGVEAIVTCVDPRQIDRQLVARWYSPRFLADLPESADPCGERGEFHTLCVAGPMFDAALPVAVGEIVERDGFVFADVVPLLGPS
jgi:uncharacterized protein (TIGR00290 family)